MLEWAGSFSICCFLDSSQYKDKHSSFDWILAAGAAYCFAPVENKLKALHTFCAHHQDWLFGHLSYDLKNETEKLASAHFDGIQFPEISLFQPETVIYKINDTITISCLAASPSLIFQNITLEKPVIKIPESPGIILNQRFSKEEYINVIHKLRQHIQRGDCYEINFCLEFFSENTVIKTLQLYQRLINISPNPFCCYYKNQHNYLLCASPERYIKKTGNTIISQPIKGTVKRNVHIAEEDDENKTKLLNSRKDRSENIMIVDLIRNDLSKICIENSVNADELYGIYTFPQVYQMISTISGELPPHINFADIIKATFPMGSMTGAPKKRVMALIEKYEKTKRGIFSGAVGYITPEKDFDFNVVIRSLMYNEQNKYLSCQAGGAITFYSNPEDEYNECMLKIKAIQEVLTGS